MKKIGLCFSGGGGRGAYQVGVATALQELGILEKIHYYSGTSIGAANAALLATTSLKRCKDIWFNIPDDSLKKNEGFFKSLRKEGYKAFEKGIYQMDLFEEVLWENIDTKNLKDIEVYAAVSVGGNGHDRFDLLKASFNHFVKKNPHILYRKLNELSQEEGIQTIIASCSIPIVFPPVIKEGKKYYDGGVYVNVPVQPLVDAGCEEIYVVHLHRVHLFKAEKYPNVVFHEIKHKSGLGGILDFSSAHSKEIYDYGMQDCFTYFEEQETKKKEEAHSTFK